MVGRKAINRRALPAILGLLAIATLWMTFAARPAMATDDYTRALSQPCISCHTSGTSADLNQRGQTFADVAGHKDDPRAAWIDAVAAVPLAPSSGADASVLVPAAVLVLAAAWAYTMLRRRRQT